MVGSVAGAVQIRSEGNEVDEIVIVSGAGTSQTSKPSTTLKFDPGT
jgi:hypothetical protein